MIPTILPDRAAHQSKQNIGIRRKGSGKADSLVGEVVIRSAMAGIRFRRGLLSLLRRLPPSPKWLRRPSRRASDGISDNGDELIAFDLTWLCR